MNNKTTSTNVLAAYFDGSCNLNPGGVASYGAVIFLNYKKIWECSELFKPEKGRERMTSNNVAEYSGFLAVLKYLKGQGYQDRKIKIFGDSKLVIKQMRGKWKMHGGLYLPLALKAKALLTDFKDVYIKWIPREKNRIADELSKLKNK